MNKPTKAEVIKLAEKLKHDHFVKMGKKSQDTQRLKRLKQASELLSKRISKKVTKKVKRSIKKANQPTNEQKAEEVK